jgi:hypothetical protein
VLLNGCNKLQKPGEASIYGTLSEKRVRILHALQAAGCVTQLFRQVGQAELGDNHKREWDTGFTLSAIIYGPRSISEDVGE